MKLVISPSDPWEKDEELKKLNKKAGDDCKFAKSIENCIQDQLLGFKMAKFIFT